MNAIAHRDYSVHGSKVRLRLFDNRLEIYSPGAIPNSMTVDSLRYRQSASAACSRSARPDETWLATDRRNIMEKRGEGVPIILENSTHLSGGAGIPPDRRPELLRFTRRTHEPDPTAPGRVVERLKACLERAPADHQAFVTSKSSITRYCRSHPRNIVRASFGVHTMGSPRRLRDVLSTTAFPVRVSSASMRS